MSMKENASCRVYDWHRCDTRMTELGDTACTVTSHYGTGGATFQWLIIAQ